MFICALSLYLFFKLHEFQSSSAKLTRWKCFYVWIWRWLILRNNSIICDWSLRVLHLSIALFNPFFGRQLRGLWFLIQNVLPISDTLPDRFGKPVLAICILAVPCLNLILSCVMHRVFVLWLVRNGSSGYLLLLVIRTTRLNGVIYLFKILCSPDSAFNLLSY